MFTFTTQKGILLGILISLAILLTVLLARGARSRYGRCPIALAALARSGSGGSRESQIGPGGAIISGTQLHEGFLNELGMDVNAINEVLGLMEPDISASASNENLAIVIGFVKAHPDKSSNFLNWVRNSFFTEKTNFKSPIGEITVPSKPIFKGLAPTVEQPAAPTAADRAMEEMPASTAANIALRKITLYMSRHPDDTSDFLNYLKTTFMSPNAMFKRDGVDFKKINKEFENVFPVGM
jgi:hypothetical protein